MQTITRKKGSFDDMYFEIILTGYEKTGDDIEDMFFSIKDTLKSADNSIFLKTILTGGILFTEHVTNEGEANEVRFLKVLVEWGENEYDNFKIDKVYTGGLFVKFTGDPAADEHVDQLFKVTVVTDFLQQN